MKKILPIMLEALIFLSGICIAVLSSNVAIIDNLPPPVNPSVIAKATYCSVAGIGYGSTHPIFITPRPRILLICNAHVGDTWVGEIFTDKGFYAWGTQIRTAFGFTGGGITLGIPLCNAFAFYGYAWYASILANYVQYKPQ